MKAATWQAMAMAAVVLAAQAASVEAARPEDKDQLKWQLGRKAAAATLAMGKDGVWAEACVVVANSAEEWDRAMNEMAAAGKLVLTSGPAAPAVDWSRHSVVLVALGQQLQMGYGVQVREARRLGNRLMLDVQVQVPASGWGCEPYSPYHLLLVERRGAAAQAEAYYDYSVAGAQAQSLELPASSEAQASSGPATLQVSWGAVKGQYR